MSTSIYRLGTANTYDNALRNLGTRQSQLSNLQENLTSGKRVVRASDDPVSAAQAERALNRIERIKVDQRALESQKNSITQAEASLGDAVNLIQEARQLIVNAGSGTLKPQDRATIANQLQGLREQLVEVANRKDTNGLPLLGALGSALAPFLGPQSSLPDYDFAGLPGQVSGTGLSIPNTLDGDSAFMFSPQRDGVYNAGVTATDPLTGLAVPLPNDRSVNTSAITVTDRTLVTGNNYTVTFGPESPGATPGTVVRDINITEIDPATGGVLASNVVSLPEYDPKKPLNVEIPGTDPATAPTLQALIPGIKFTITAKPSTTSDGTVVPSPVTGDTVSLRTESSLFGVLDTAIQALREAPNSNVANQAVSQALANIDTGLERVHNMRSYAGELLNRADRITGDQEKRSIQLEGDRSRAEDLDMIKGIADFQNQQVGYEAALKSYAQVQKLSLFNFIG